MEADTSVSPPNRYQGREGLRVSEIFRRRMANSWAGFPYLKGEERNSRVGMSSRAMVKRV